ncbi:MAG: RNA 2',3'-cyclic phosphodiesterase [bacterium]|nr:RNA 2',3'-cyclic phosphodiesterase [bacterium]
MALEIPPEIRSELAERCRAARGGLPKARWVRPKAMHLTLVFLGETAPESLPDLHREMGAAFDEGESMEIRIGGFGAFPPRGRRRVVWAGVEAEGDLAGLQARVARAAERAVGHEREARPYHPHLTLARCKPPWPASAVGRLIEGLGPPPARSFMVEHGSLISSVLHPAGARYETVETYPLGAVT